MDKKALIPLAALAALGAGCSGTPTETAEDEVVETEAARDYIYEKHLSDATLLFDREMGGERVQKYVVYPDAWHRGDSYEKTFVRVTQPDGTIITYADDFWKDEQLDWIAFASGNETGIYKPGLIEITMDGETVESREHPDAGKRVIGWGQIRFDDYLLRIDELDSYADDQPYNNDIQPLEEWARNQMLKQATGPVRERLMASEGEAFIWQNYLKDADLLLEWSDDEETVREYLGRDAYYLVKNADGTSIFYSDWLNDNSMDAFAVTSNGKTVFFEGSKTRVFLPGKEQQEIWLHAGEELWEFAQTKMRGYSDNSSSIEPLAPFEEWALELLKGPASEPVEVEAREIPEYIWDEYISWSYLEWEQQTGRALVRKYIEQNTATIESHYFVVDQADGTSLFFSDYMADGSLDSFAVTEGEKTVFFELMRMFVFTPEGKETLEGSAWAARDEAEKLFRRYSLPEQESTDKDVLEHWALDGLTEE